MMSLDQFIERSGSGIECARTRTLRQVLAIAASLLPVSEDPVYSDACRPSPVPYSRVARRERPDVWVRLQQACDRGGNTGNNRH